MFPFFEQNRKSTQNVKQENYSILLVHVKSTEILNLWSAHILNDWTKVTQSAFPEQSLL